MGAIPTSLGNLGTIPSHITSQYGDNPVFMKFLMSRQSDASSVAGFSNVESGSQPDLDSNGQRRSSLTSVTSEPNSAGDFNTKRSSTESKLFSKSVDVLTGSTETITTLKTREESAESDRSTPVQSVEPASRPALGLTLPKSAESINAGNSVSFINSPLEKVGFVTLEALMKGGTDLGKMLTKSIESLEASPLHKQTSNDSNVSSGKEATRRERRDSSFSIGSDCSDTERRKVSMKYMGTLPEGLNYEAFVKQMSNENKNKNIKITVFSSPDALKNTPTSSHSLTPTVQTSKVFTPRDPSEKSDAEASNRTLTDFGEEQSVISLGEQIKRLCDGQRTSHDTSNLEMVTPRSGTDTFDEITPRIFSDKEHRTPERKIDNQLHGTHTNQKLMLPIEKADGTTVDDLFISVDTNIEKPLSGPASKKESQPAPNVMNEAMSPIRKRLKSKKERDQKSRRKQKESFLKQITSDTNSENENDLSSNTSKLQAKWTKSEEELCQSGSEERTPRYNTRSSSTPLKSVPAVSLQRKSLLDEVQLETETPSDSCEDRALKLAGRREVV